MQKEDARICQTRGIPVGNQSGQIITDPNGSYTGRPRDPEDRPIQDADDL